MCFFRQQIMRLPNPKAPLSFLVAINPWLPPGAPPQLLHSPCATTTHPTPLLAPVWAQAPVHGPMLPPNAHIQLQSSRVQLSSRFGAPGGELGSGKCHPGRQYLLLSHS